MGSYVRSLTFKVILAFAAVCLIEALIVAFLVRDSTRRSFDRFVEGEALRIFTEDIASFHEANGSLDGMHLYLEEKRQTPHGNRHTRLPMEEPGARSGPGSAGPARGAPNRGGPGGMAPGRRGAGNRGPMYGFADTLGRVVISNGAYQVGDFLTKEDFDERSIVDVSPGLSGFILSPGVDPIINPEARRYLVDTDRALGFALGGGFLVALVIGALFARTYMKPLRELTVATQAISKGDTYEPVEVRTKDEIGLLTTSFNQMVSELERVNQSRKQMTADIAHELRSPLGILTGYLEAFQSGDLKPSPERVNTMFAEAKHLERLIEDLRMLALADAGELPLSLQDVSIHELLDHASAAFSQAAKEEHVDLHVEHVASIPLMPLDPVRMPQVLSNLIGNALRYTPPGGSITLSAHQMDNCVEIRVQDTGSGISKEALPYIFDRFYKADASRTGYLETTGLGLPIAKSIVEAHNGRIAVVSEEGMGTTVSVILPQS